MWLWGRDASVQVLDEMDLPAGREDDARESVRLEHVYSCEYFMHEKGVYEQVLRDITFCAHRGEIWEVAGGSAFEQRLLLEIVANAKPYQKGRCILGRQGMMRRKSTILPHVFYLGSSNMLLEGYTVIGYLVYLTAHAPLGPESPFGCLIASSGGRTSDISGAQGVSAEASALRGGLIRDFLHQMALADLADRLVEDLSAAERSLIALVSALLTDSAIIIMNLPRLVFDERCVRAFGLLCELVRGQERTLVMASQDYRLAQAGATHILLLDHGEVIETSELGSFVSRWDHSVMDIRDDDMTPLCARLQMSCPNLVYETDGAGCLHIEAPADRPATSDDRRDVYRALTGAGLYPAEVRRIDGLLDRAVGCALEAR